MQAKEHVRAESANVFNKLIRAPRGLWWRTTRRNLAKPKPGAELAPLPPKFRMRDLWRVTLWGLAAAGLLVLTVYGATSTEIGRDRLHVAVAGIHEILMPSGIKPIRPLDAREGRRLAETVRGLAGDRERLLARIATLEQNMDGITGSIARAERAAKMAAVPDPAAESPPNTEPPSTGDDVTSSINPPASVPMPPPPPSSNVARTEFGLDLGSASTIEALRTAWASALRRHGTLLEGLHPVVKTRERPRAGGTEFRLIAGPIPNAATAARLCATMTVSGAVCAPAVFEGQRLAGR